MKPHGSVTGANLESKRDREERLYSTLPKTKFFNVIDYALLNGIAIPTAKHHIRELAQANLIVFEHKKWRKK